MELHVAYGFIGVYLKKLRYLQSDLGLSCQQSAKLVKKKYLQFDFGLCLVRSTFGKRALEKKKTFYISKITRHPGDL